ncbi:hypothetical protein SAMN04488054_104179 [Salibacterium qingdaonense]|uniref:Uncharacterized protein n=1 Tax=Salibacterium qingdaonense TaxID=266892 RepID=A0A1I4K8U2_9BACI|nr:hypothetical protein SAMN04488054_104179 [Salibacterium qingdaonense]
MTLYTALKNPDDAADCRNIVRINADPVFYFPGFFSQNPVTAVSNQGTGIRRSFLLICLHRWIQ